MNTERDSLLAEIEAFIRESGMGEAYFGQAAVVNSKLIPRLRKGESVTVDTAARVRTFMAERRARHGHGEQNSAA